MKKRLSLATLLFLLNLGVQFVHGQQLAVQSNDGKQVVLGRTEIEGLARVQITTGSASAPATYEGVTLKSVLEKAGIGFGESLKGKRLAYFLRKTDS
jgi:hypothetical protein